MGVDIQCGPAAFGVAHIPWPIPQKLQGRNQKFEVGASVKYPSGKGKMLRFRDGVAIRGNAQFTNAFGTTLTLASAAGGGILLSSPASVTVLLPKNVAEEISSDASIQVETLWHLDQEDES